MNMDRPYMEPLYLLKPTKNCLRTSINPGLIIRDSTVFQDPETLHCKINLSFYHSIT